MKENHSFNIMIQKNEELIKKMTIYEMKSIFV
jgi:hypothetical protein